MPPDKKNEPKFLSLISSNTITSFKKKIRKDENDPCPIKTLNQLFDPSLAVPKTNISLRSLRSKPSQHSSRVHPPSQPQENLSDSKKVSNGSSKTNDETVNRTSCDTSRAVRSEANVKSSDDSRTADPEAIRNKSIFAVPMMRAPRTLKRDPSLMNQLRKKALFTWCTLDEEMFKKLIYILITYELKVIEEYEPESSETRDNFNNGNIRALVEWVQNFSDTGSNVTSSRNNVPPGMTYGPGFCDMDNVSSVSGYQPSYQGPIMNRYIQDLGSQSSVVNEKIPATYNTHNQIADRYRHFNPTYHEENQLRYQPNISMGSSFLPDNGPLKSGNFPFRSNKGSFIGSAYQPRSDPYGNQHSFMQNNQPMMGYPSRALSMRLDGSFARPYQPVGCSNCSTIAGQSTYSNMNQMSQMNGNPGDPLREYNESERRAPSLVNGMGGMQFDSVGSNLLEQTGRGIGHSRNILAPLQPRVVLNRMDMADGNIPVRNMGFYNSSQMPARSQREPSLERSNFSYNVRNTNRTSSVQNLNEMGCPRKSLNRVQDSSVLMRTVHRRVDPENCLIADEPQERRQLREERLMRLSSRPSVSSISTLTNARAHPPQTPSGGSVMNQSGIISVTRSGRAVRAPQAFWSTEMSFVSTTKNNDRGVKRKRN